MTSVKGDAAADGEMMTSYYREEITGLPEMGVVATSGLILART